MRRTVGAEAEGGGSGVVLWPNWPGFEHEVEGRVSEEVAVRAGVIFGGLSTRTVDGGKGGGVVGEVLVRDGGGDVWGRG